MFATQQAQHLMSGYLSINCMVLQSGENCLQKAGWAMAQAQMWQVERIAWRVHHWC